MSDNYKSYRLSKAGVADKIVFLNEVDNNVFAPATDLDKSILGAVACAPINWWTGRMKALGYSFSSITWATAKPKHMKAPGPHSTIPHDAQRRKEAPMCAGLLDYFPAALFEVARHSWLGNEKHNPGEPLHHARGKSMDHADCVVRHLIERGTVEQVTLPDGRVVAMRASAALAWRALAILQEEMEAEGAAMPRGAKEPEPSPAKDEG